MQSEIEIDNYSVSPALGRLTGMAGFAILTGGSAAVAYFDPATQGIFPVCPLYALTGFACPGCGLTRGFHALFHGDLITALDYNALIPIWAAVIFWIWLSLLFMAFRGKGLAMWPTRPNFLWGFFIVLMVFGVLRNVPIYPLSVLFP